MSTKKVTNPNQKSNAGFLWAIVAVLLIGAVIVGYIVISGRGNQAEELAQYQEDVNFELEYADSNITLSSSPDAEEATLYEDFSCTYCAQLAADTDEQMMDEVEAGNLTVHVSPLVFMDNGSEGHSTHALAASLALADAGETNAYLSLRAMMMGEQQNIFNQWDNEDFANAAQTYGASEESVTAIANGDYIQEATALGEANAETLQQQTGSVSTPRILQDGEELPLQQEGLANADWIDYVLAS